MPSLDWSQCPTVESVPAKAGGAWMWNVIRLPEDQGMVSPHAGANRSGT